MTALATRFLFTNNSTTYIPETNHWKLKKNNHPFQRKGNKIYTKQNKPPITFCSFPKHSFFTGRFFSPSPQKNGAQKSAAAPLRTAKTPGRSKQWPESTHRREKVDFFGWGVHGGHFKQHTRNHVPFVCMTYKMNYIYNYIYIYIEMDLKWLLVISLIVMADKTCRM